MKKFQAFFSKKSSRFTPKSEKKYKRRLIFFLLLYVSLFVSSAFSPEKRTYQLIGNGETLSLGETTLQVIDRYYDPKTKEFQLNVWLDTDNESLDLFRYAIKADTITKDNSEEKLMTTVHRGDQYYFSIVTKNVPNDFTALRQTLHVSTDQLDSDSPEQEVKLYSEPSQATSKEIITTDESLKGQSLDVQVKKLKKEITTIEGESENLKKESKKVRQLKKKIQADLPYQVADEKELSEKKMETYQLKLNEIDETVAQNTEKISLINQKVALLMTKR